MAVNLNIIIVRRIMGIPGGDHADTAIDVLVVSPIIHCYDIIISPKISSWEECTKNSCSNPVITFPMKSIL